MSKINAKYTSSLLRAADRWRSWPVVLLFVFITVSTLGFMFIDSRYSFIDALYMTFITIATVGFREIHNPEGWAIKAWTIFVISGGLVCATAVASMIGAMIVEGRIRNVLGRRQLQRKIEGLSGHTIVCGYGLMGSQVADQLKAGGRNIVIMDSDPQRTQLAGQQGYLYILGNAHEEQTLTQAGALKAKALVAALNSDAENVFLTLSARGMNPNLKIIARARDESSTVKLYKAGATTVICPHILGASRIANTILRPAVMKFVEVARKGIEIEMDQLELSETSPLIGKTLQELQLPAKAGVQVCAVQRQNEPTSYQPAPDFVLQAGDILILVGKTNAAGVLQKLGVNG